MVNKNAIKLSDTCVCCYYSKMGRKIKTRRRRVKRKKVNGQVGGIIGLAVSALATLAEEAGRRLVKADFTTTKKKEFDKLYKGVRSRRTGRKPNWWSGGWYKTRKNPQSSKYHDITAGRSMVY